MCVYVGTIGKNSLWLKIRQLISYGLECIFQVQGGVLVIRTLSVENLIVPFLR